ncbi:hypothetical protein CO151_03255 [bacterium CG_4_9_14_3_um_filter_65_15]|nr:MAG: hypothetical protein CO151_03255 [bacterium CG_4_9_14_3_um_filter_65_15]
MIDFKSRYRMRVLLPAVIVSCLISAPVAAQTAGLSLVPSVGSFDCGETFTLDLMVDAQTIDLHGSSVVLEFNDAILAPLAVQPGALVTGAACPYFFDWTNASAIGDSIAVDLANLGCSVEGPGSILRVTFEGSVSGVSAVDCRSGILRDSLNQDIPYTCTGAEVNYLCPIADDPQAWGSLKALYR